MMISALILALLFLGGGVWWLTHPNRLIGVGSEMTVQVPLGRSVVVGLFAGPQEGKIRVVRATPRVIDNGANADVHVLLCRSKPGTEPVGAFVGTAAQLCASASDPHDALVGHLIRGGSYLVLEATPHRAGTLRVAGLHVDYWAGLRRGRQDSGMIVTVSAVPAP